MNKFQIFFFCGIALLTTACAVQSSSESKTAPTVSAAPDSIIGSWTVRQIDSVALSDSTVSFPVIAFHDEGRVVANAGCNTLSGEYTYTASVNAEKAAPASLTFSDKLCQTLMLCPDEEITRNEQLLALAMDSVLTVTSCGTDSLCMQGKHYMLLVKSHE